MNLKNLILYFFFIFLTIGNNTIAQQKKQPNILWITSEDNSADWLGCYGNKYAETPNIDKLAKEGFLYTNAFSNASACSPSRSTWITGINAVSMGTHHQRSRYRIPHNKIKYYPDLLKEAGYYTANFDKTDYNIGGRNDKECWDNTENVNWETLKNEQPFFQVINTHKSHESRVYGKLNETTHNPDSTVLRKYHPDLPITRKTYAQYLDSIKAMDGEVGLALKNLKKVGLAENTIVIYASDHGGVMPRSKRYLHRNSLHCPLIVRIPKKYKNLWPSKKAGIKIDRLVSFVDMPKTWLSLAKASIPDYMQGTIFLGKNKEPETDYHFAFRGRMEDGVENSRALIDNKFLYIRNYNPYTPWMHYHFWIWGIEFTRSWEQLVLNGKATKTQSQFFKAKGSEELYNIIEDPDCIKNLANLPEYSKEVARMSKALKMEQLKINDAGLLPETEMNRLAKKHNTTVYELAQNPSIYNTKALLDAANIALEGNPKNLNQLREMLNNKNLGIRYWGLIGCFMLNDQLAGIKLINDESHEIRAMAAWILIRTGMKEEGIACIEKLLGEKGSFYAVNPPSYAHLTVLNIIDWMGEDGKKLMPIVRKQAFESNNAKEYRNGLRVRDHLIEKFSRY
ncbi:Sulfatase [Lutibacter oricola]|uniref:Sulfatase n=1 Tax=Lutibacter oricola TaxID=762486 RepID=A0A1H2WSU7_9FLAO|nr:sulfatase [Lutibacter oricola]SDW83641.1 Sulfatase [Lutibacter oricola]